MEITVKKHTPYVKYQFKIIEKMNLMSDSQKRTDIEPPTPRFLQGKKKLSI